MPRFLFKLPDIGEGIAEAEIVAWHVAVGDRIEEDQNIADMMTDKATVEMESPVSGVVVELVGEVGDQVPIGSTLVVIETHAGEENAAPDTAHVPVSDGVAARFEAEDELVEEGNGTPSTFRGEGQAQAATRSTSPLPDPLPGGEREHKGVLASPAVRQRAMELGVDLSSVKTDSDRVRHSDLDAFLRYGSRQGYHAPHASRAREDETVRVIGLRRRIAENMAASKRHIPHFTYVDECDVTALEAMRADLNADRGDRPKLTVLPLLIAAICRTLPEFPMLNARYDDTVEGGAGVVTRSGRVHIGVAVHADAGLIVQVIRDAQDRNVWQLASEIDRLANAARANTLISPELGGATITVTSLGPLGGIVTTPVITRPQVAIIGPNRIVDRPVFRGDEIVRAKLMNVSISCDHRVVDGWDAASYVQALKRCLETPVLLFAPREFSRQRDMR